MSSPSFIVYGVRHSAYSYTYLSRLLDKGFRPSCILSIDQSSRNQAASRSLMAHGGKQYPLINSAWEKGGASCCLLELAEKHDILYIAVPDFLCPKLALYLRQNVPDVIVATDGPIVRGAMLYAAKNGVLSVHSAQLPTFRGNWTTYFNLYHNLPLVVSAFIMQPWVDEGILLDSREVPVYEGMNLAQVNEAALNSSIDLACDVLKKMAKKELSIKRQEPWEGEIFRGSYDKGVLQPAMPLAQQQELADRMDTKKYGFYTRIA